MSALGLSWPNNNKWRRWSERGYMFGAGLSTLDDESCSP